jgi:crotonobetainyl-CoA:carnitine CoA-transferase CaiB-like acyl-CoA transferase
MSAVEERFAAFTSAWERGEDPDPAAVLADASEDERPALGAMIAAYLSANPRTDVPEEVVAARAADAASEPPLAWPELLPDLRRQARVTRSALVRRLAAALGFPEATEQVEEHVHGLETGRLPAGRVRPAVVAGLASILDVPESLLEAGRRIGRPGVQPAAMAAFSRAERARDAAAPTEELRASPARNPEVDDLFTGADG